MEKKIEDTNAAIEVLRKEKEEKDEVLKGLESQMDVARTIQQVRKIEPDFSRTDNCSHYGSNNISLLQQQQQQQQQHQPQQ